MYHRRRSRILLAVLILTALVLITVDFRGGEQGPMWRLRGLATTLFAPVQDGLATVLSPVSDAFASVGDLFRLRSENADLKARLDELSQRHRSFEDLERENEELRKLLAMKDRTGFDVLPAQVISLGPSNYEWTVTLDVGADDGVAKDMVVIDGDGLVGRVVQVTPNASRVLLAIDHNFSAASRDARMGETGPVDGRGGDLMVFHPLDPEATIRKGDQVVTAAYDNGLFPSGIPIGQVEDVGEATTLLNRDVLVRPYVDFTRLDHVLVVLHTPPSPVPSMDPGAQGDYTPPHFAPSPTPTPSAAPSPAASPDAQP